ncbi:hypothetical protein Tco_1450081 [Tanacetum coccineum]
MQEAVNVAVQLKYDRFREESTSANQQFLDSIDDGMKKIIKKEVRKEVSKIIPKVEKLVTDQLESEVLVRSSKEANTSHAVAANLSELELKRILIDKMEANNSINRSDIQKQLYKALVEAYEADQILLDTYGDTVTIKRPRDGADDDEEPSAGTDRGSKRRRSGKEPASTSAPSETTTKTAGQTTSAGTTTHTKSASQSVSVGMLCTSTDVLLRTETRSRKQVSMNLVHLGISNLAQQDPESTFDENNDSSFDFSALSALWGISHWGKKRRQFYAFATSRESARDVYSKRRIIAVTQVEIVEWHDYKHLDWITVRRDDDLLYKFKEGDFHRLRIQDIEDMLLLLVQGKVTNLNVEERIAFNVSLRMFTRRVVIQRRVEDLQLGVESYQKKLNLTKPDTYRSNLRRQDAYTPYSDPRGFIYENKDKKNRLITP